MLTVHAMLAKKKRMPKGAMPLTRYVTVQAYTVIAPALYIRELKEY